MENGQTNDRKMMVLRNIPYDEEFLPHLESSRRMNLWDVFKISMVGLRIMEVR